MPSSHWRRIQNLNGKPVRPLRPEPNHITLRGLTLAEIEAYAIRSSVERNRKIRLVCEELGISKSTLHRKMNALGLRKPRSFTP
jgi:transcriptional regulator with PAS, ATPase and Fis domain